ncbi:hypothetical protein pb186bvf_006399 [Paramecium bursaria]
MSQIQKDFFIEYDYYSEDKYSQEAVSVLDDQNFIIYNNAGKKMQRNCWTNEEDKLLIQSVQRYGQDWKRISKQFNKNQIERGPKACRERYQNQLSPLVKKKNWSKDEENKLFQLQNQLGNKWSDIAEQLPNRTDQIVKNYFYATVRRVLRRLLKAAGNKNCSDLAREIKPCVLSRIFSLNEKEDKRIVLDTQFTQLFRGLILKYRNISFSGSVNVSSEDQQKVSYIYENLVKINYQYKDEKEALQQQKVKIIGPKPLVQLSIKDIQKKQGNYQEKVDEILLDKIVKKKPIFTTTVIPIEKHYKQIKQVENKGPQYVIQEQCLQMPYIVPVYFTQEFQYQVNQQHIMKNVSQNYTVLNGDEYQNTYKPMYETIQCPTYSIVFQIVKPQVPMQSVYSILSIHSFQNFAQASYKQSF